MAGSCREQVFDILLASGWTWRIVLEGATLDATRAAIESGLGVSLLLREAVRNIGIREVKHVRLPVLPEIQFGLFRCEGGLTRAQSLMEATLSASLRPARPQSLTDASNIHAWPPDSDLRREWKAN